MINKMCHYRVSKSLDFYAIANVISGEIYELNENSYRLLKYIDVEGKDLEAVCAFSNSLGISKEETYQFINFLMEEHFVEQR